MKKQLFHGSDHIIETPIYGVGKKHNDYGQGFYCTEDIALAKEWAVSEEKDGYVNEYEIETNGLHILNINDGSFTLLHWMGLLLNNRAFVLATPLEREAKRYITDCFPVPLAGVDVIIGYRADDSYFSYARDFMIDRGFTYCVPPFMIHGNVVNGVMSFAEMESMMYKIEGEDLYLIGTSEHSMIGKFIDSIIPEEKLPLTLTSYSPCFRKEKGAHGIEERGVYRIHQFEKQEMVVVCKPEDSMMWYDKLWKNTVDLFRSMDIPVRTLECCSGDLADLKVKSVDVEAWSPRQKKYFEVGSCSNLGDAQARRLKIRVNGEDGKKYLAHTLNNTVVAPPRMLIAFLENNLNADGTVSIPEVLRMYMGGKEKLVPKH